MTGGTGSHRCCIVTHKLHQRTNLQTYLSGSLVSGGNNDNNVLKEPFSSLKSTSWDKKFQVLWVETRVNLYHGSVRLKNCFMLI